jgi:hypothetical protein
MIDRLIGLLFMALGLLAISTSVAGLVQGRVWFLGRGRDSLTLIDIVGAPALYWFVVCFYVFSGVAIALWGARLVRHDDRRV